MARAHLVLANGTVFEGESFGAGGTSIGEVVFNTGMTGYQEILTDPSYAGQLVTLTYPLIGNYGVTEADFESRRVQAAGLIIKELCDVPSNWRSEGTLASFLERANIIGIHGIDTRKLTREIRSAGVMMGAISTDGDIEALKNRIASVRYETIDFVSQVSTGKPFVWNADGDVKYRIALLDCGVKFNILRSLAKLGAETTVWPARTSADAILATTPDGVFLSPGPGDPDLLGDIKANVRRLAESKPTMGICLGNQLIGCAFGGRTYKLPFGHRGSNHPVKDLTTGRVVITSQNHGYALAPEFTSPDIEVWQVNLNDGTVEGLRHKSLPVFSIQYHPEASPGPTDSKGYFGQFLRMIDQNK
ncbi:MAG: glutamine-hydrolyzing carbamoyl-phosphate synthase small subunit [Capsulimonadaceae bacterium]|nr:glutamine-hydrolyzing carbamoyl-phosphate synthase small subunit [Capsulimonadaceae bacterium]